jgi:rhodanese-related sulfurtransferase
MGEVPARFGEIPREVPVYVMCHGGVRSGRVVEFLRGQGFDNARNVQGGIAAWSAEIDGSVPVY